MKATIIKSITFLLIVLWVYVAFGKLLDYEQSRCQVLNLSLLLLLLFRSYMSLVMLNAFGRVPSSCGGILDMSWGQHFVFNLFFMASTITALFLRRDQWSAYKPGNSPHWKGGAMRKVC